MKTDNTKELTLEESFGELDRIVRLLEGTDISLEESFKLYEEGMKLVKSCNDKIDKVEKKVQVLSDEGELNDF